MVFGTGAVIHFADVNERIHATGIKESVAFEGGTFPPCDIFDCHGDSGFEPAMCGAWDTLPPECLDCSAGIELRIVALIAMSFYRSASWVRDRLSITTVFIFHSPWLLSIVVASVFPKVLLKALLPEPPPMT